MKNIDEKYMRIALKEANNALLLDEVPVGAIIVDGEGKILAKGFNKRESSFDPTSHAEINAIRKACKKRKTWRLTDCTIYVTIEPCAMCAGTILWARMKRVVFGAPDLKGGALGTTFNLYSVDNLNHYPEVTPFVLKEECGNIISNYFKAKRDSK
ncbi:MAG: nucleoside deaminase [Bacilli bacterium]|nr:nucleoside deaminase [Bacilli bacterium]